MLFQYPAYYFTVKIFLYKLKRATSWLLFFYLGIEHICVANCYRC